MKDFHSIQAVLSQGYQKANKCPTHFVLFVLGKADINRGGSGALVPRLADVT